MKKSHIKSVFKMVGYPGHKQLRLELDGAEYLFEYWKSGREYFWEVWDRGTYWDCGTVKRVKDLEDDILPKLKDTLKCHPDVKEKLKEKYEFRKTQDCYTEDQKEYDKKMKRRS